MQRASTRYARSRKHPAYRGMTGREGERARRTGVEETRENKKTEKAARDEKEAEFLSATSLEVV